MHHTSFTYIRLYINKMPMPFDLHRSLNSSKYCLDDWMPEVGPILSVSLSSLRAAHEDSVREMTSRMLQLILNYRSDTNSILANSCCDIKPLFHGEYCPRIA